MELRFAGTLFHMSSASVPPQETSAAASSGGAATRYTHVAIALHWLIAAMVLCTIPLGLIGARLKSGAGEAVVQIHKPLGMIILALTLVRIVWRIGHRPPPLPEKLAPGLRIAARSVQMALYALLIVMPVSGWWMTSAFHKHQVNFFSLFAVPYLPVKTGMTPAIAAHTVHETMGWFAIALIGLHIAATLKHQFIDRDYVLSLMLGKQAPHP